MRKILTDLVPEDASHHMQETTNQRMPLEAVIIPQGGVFTLTGQGYAFQHKVKNRDSSWSLLCVKGACWDVARGACDTRVVMETTYISVWGQRRIMVPTTHVFILS